MPRQQFTPEQIIGKLREVEVLVAKGSRPATSSPTRMQNARNFRAQVYRNPCGLPYQSAIMRLCMFRMLAPATPAHLEPLLGVKPIGP